MEQWIHQLLLAKGIRTFGDLQPGQLRIIASDISLGKLLVLPDDIAQYGIDPHQFLVSKAIRMSTSIPYFFDPVLIRRREPRKKKESFKDQFSYIVDGGLLSNFPLWLFDERQPDGKLIPTLGYQLVGKTTHESHPIWGPVTMLQAMVSTMLNAHDERYIEDHHRYRTIKIAAMGVATTQFSIPTEKSLNLYESGIQAAAHYFNKFSLASYTSNYETFQRKQKNEKSRS